MIMKNMLVTNAVVEVFLIAVSSVETNIEFEYELSQAILQATNEERANLQISYVTDIILTP
jgi:hypothetical protein